MEGKGLSGRTRGLTLRHEVGPATLVVIPAGIPHGFKSVGDEPVDFILFSSPKFDAADTMKLE